MIGGQLPVSGPSLKVQGSDHASQRNPIQPLSFHILPSPSGHTSREAPTAVIRTPENTVLLKGPLRSLSPYSTTLFQPCPQDSLPVKGQPEILTVRCKISASCSFPIPAIEPAPLPCFEGLIRHRRAKGLLDISCGRMTGGLGEIDVLTGLTASKEQGQESCLTHCGGMPSP